jgi:hypothetical protein
VHALAASPNRTDAFGATHPSTKFGERMRLRRCAADSLGVHLLAPRPHMATNQPEVLLAKKS